MFADEPENQMPRLDHDHVLEPAEGSIGPGCRAEPLLRDVTGRTWRVRTGGRSPEVPGWVLVFTSLVLSAILLTAMLQGV